METMFGPIAQNGDYVVVVDFNWMKRKCNVYIARVYRGMAYTGVKNFPHDRNCIHKKKVICVIPVWYVDEDDQERIRKDIEGGGCVIGSSVLYCLHFGYTISSKPQRIKFCSSYRTEVIVVSTILMVIFWIVFLWSWANS